MQGAAGQQRIDAFLVGQEHGSRQRPAKGSLQAGEQSLDLLASIGRVRPVEGGEARRQLHPFTARHGVIRHTQADGIRPVEAGPGEAEPEPEPPGMRLKNQLAPTSG